MAAASKSPQKWLPIALLIGLVGLVVWMLFPKPGHMTSLQTVSVHGIYFTEPNDINPFQLKSTKGKSFTDQDLRGHWTLMFFGFTHCPDVCPTTLALLNTTLEKFKETSPKLKAPEVVFVSVDPARDDIAAMKKYVSYFNPKFMGATGSDEALRTLTRQVGVVYDKIELDDNPDNYAMEHSTSIILVNPRGAIQAIFTAPHDADTLSQELTAVYQAYKKG
ncbi:MAG: SCO family protein [Gammaproteobacteria bacterium]